MQRCSPGDLPRSTATPKPVAAQATSAEGTAARVKTLKEKVEPAEKAVIVLASWSFMDDALRPL